jgi:hypothetical protein
MIKLKPLRGNLGRFFYEVFAVTPAGVTGNSLSDAKSVSRNRN